MMYLGKARRFFDELSSTVLFVLCDPISSSREAILLLKEKIAAVVKYALAMTMLYREKPCHL
ncbi:hypothetical protein QE439_003817 [Pedobacter agri]|nr:hypothetical protein [Pedobacter agri]